MLDIDMEFKKGVLFIKLLGDLKKDTVTYYENNIMDTIKNNGIKYCALDLENISYIDKYGFSAIRRSYDLILENKGKFFIYNAGSSNKIGDNLYGVAEESEVYSVAGL